MEKIYEFITSVHNLFSTDSPHLQILYKVILVVVGTLLSWCIIKWILNSAEKKASKYKFIQINSELFHIIRKAIFYGLILGAGTYLIRFFKLPILEKCFQSLLIILLAYPAKEFLKMVIEYLQTQLAHKTENKVDDIIFDLLNKFAGAIIYAIAIIIALDLIGVNIMPFIAGAGVAGIAIGFAAKDTLSNLIAGILLIIDRPFEVGDRIEVWSAPSGSATWGDVIDIGLRATKIRTTDHIIIVIPNNEIMTRDIVNYTLTSEKIRVRVNIGVAYDTDITKAKKIILDVADSADWVAKDPVPKVVVRNFGESSVDLQLRVWIKEARKRMDTISYITDQVKEAFDREGVEIPYPKRDIYVTQRSG
ncbi:MAG: mechanosensitive ion channel family protein [Desulfobacterales bacterium]|nr:MAG: mechanosensitive ion channel family protein [Desulfobacterales bacterium]